jgi:xanthine dehydrogenase YagT iron-sulfur-binding subunit
MKKDEDSDDSSDNERHVISRRGFLTMVGAGSVAIAVSENISAGKIKESEVVKTEEMTKLTLDINGRRHRLLVEPRWTLLFVLREKLGITGTKVGCERGECGACTVLIDKVPRYACMTLAVEAEGTRIVTVEGLMKGEALGPVQQAFLEKDAFQCGYCTPGQIMAVEGLLASNPDPTPEEVRRGVSGNICRCGAYVNIFKAAHYASELRRGKGGV